MARSKQTRLGQQRWHDIVDAECYAIGGLLFIGRHLPYHSTAGHEYGIGINNVNDVVNGYIPAGEYK